MLLAESHGKSRHLAFGCPCPTSDAQTHILALSPDVSFLLTHILGDNSDGSSAWVLPPAWEAPTELPALDLGVGQSQPLQAFGGWTGGRRSLVWLSGSQIITILLKFKENWNKEIGWLV